MEYAVGFVVAYALGYAIGTAMMNCAWVERAIAWVERAIDRLFERFRR